MTDRERALRTRLERFYSASQVDRWMKWKHPQLQGCRAAEVIAAGKIEEVERVVDRLEGGAFV